jgi:ATP-dependent DNA helicase Rep
VDDNERITATHHGALRRAAAAYQSVDFDDLIGMPLKLLRDFDEVRAKWQATLGHILVDEYQDTNATQYEVLKAAGRRARPLHRGGRRRPVDLRLARRHAGQPAQAAGRTTRPQGHQAGAELPLHQRDPARGQQRDRPQPQAVSEDAVLRTRRRRAGAHRRRRQRGARGRARWRASQPRAGDAITAGKQDKEFRDFAILYRANHQARVFEQALRKAQIPYKVSGGQSFFDRAEIKDLCGWFRLWVNNDDDPAFLRAITTPKRGIGHTTLASLGTFASQYKLSLFEALFSPSLPSVMPKRTLEGSLHEFGRYINDLEYRARRTMGAEDAHLHARLAEGHRLREAPVRRRGQREGRRRALDQRAGVRRLDVAARRRQIDDASGADNNVETERKSLLEVAQTISLLSTISEREQDQNVVTLSTLHASKGLEWPHVMLAA